MAGGLELTVGRRQELVDLFGGTRLNSRDVIGVVDVGRLAVAYESCARQREHFVPQLEIGAVRIDGSSGQVSHKRQS